VEEILQADTVEVDAQRVISLEMTRRWPKYVVSWAVRRQVGESDFPLARGEIDRLPPRESFDLEELWADMRREALDQAMAAVEQAPAREERVSGFRSLINRLTGRG